MDSRGAGSGVDGFVGGVGEGVGYVFGDCGGEKDGVLGDEGDEGAEGGDVEG